MNYLKSFNQDLFLDYVRQKGTLLKFRHRRKYDWLKFYKQFLQSSNFHSWLTKKEEQANFVMRRQYLISLSDFNVKVWLEHRHEVEIIDLLLRLKTESVCSF